MMRSTFQLWKIFADILIVLTHYKWTPFEFCTTIPTQAYASFTEFDAKYTGRSEAQMTRCNQYIS